MNVELTDNALNVRNGETATHQNAVNSMPYRFKQTENVHQQGAAVLWCRQPTRVHRGPNQQRQRRPTGT